MTDLGRRCRYCNQYYEAHDSIAACSKELFIAINDCAREYRLKLLRGLHEVIAPASACWYSDVCARCYYLEIDHVGEQKWCVLQATTFKPKLVR